MPSVRELKTERLTHPPFLGPGKPGDDVEPERIMKATLKDLYEGVPMDEVAGRTVGLDEVLGKPGRVLAERLEEAPDWPTRFALLDEAVSARIGEAPEPNRGVAWAWNRLRETHGRVSVGELGEELGWSPKRLIQRFREHVGLPPKTVARVLRFHRVVELLLRAEGNRMGELAYAAGYYDQAHFNRDFRAFAGTTPCDFLSRRLAGGGFAG